MQLRKEGLVETDRATIGVDQLQPPAFIEDMPVVAIAFEGVWKSAQDLGLGWICIVAPDGHRLLDTFAWPKEKISLSSFTSSMASRGGSDDINIFRNWQPEHVR